jgi:hypothetical protein
MTASLGLGEVLAAACATATELMPDSLVLGCCTATASSSGAPPAFSTARIVREALRLGISGGA